MTKQKTVYVGMSGGVDSSVSASLLKQQGYNVVGVFIKVWSPEWLPCNWPTERRDAMRVASHLKIPFVTLDLEKEYKRDVADYMISEYKAGNTPNPDVMCNKQIKFGAFYKWAIAQGADFVGTGHYAQILSSSGKAAGLRGSVDENKDQTYFLWNIKKDQLKHILFPVGHLKKEQVRKLAKKFKLPVAEKRDSQGICFLGKIDIKDFLKHYIKTKKGNVLNEKGEVVGTHNGALLYTIGEHYIGYIISRDLKRNTITVTSKKPEEFSSKKVFNLKNVNWIVDEKGTPAIGKWYFARVRYRQSLQKVKITSLGNSMSKCEFETPQIVATGQSIVFYNKNTCLGGGVVTKV